MNYLASQLACEELQAIGRAWMDEQSLQTILLNQVHVEPRSCSYVVELIECQA